MTQIFAIFVVVLAVLSGTSAFARNLELVAAPTRESFADEVVAWANQRLDTSVCKLSFDGNDAPEESGDFFIHVKMNYLNGHTDQPWFAGFRTNLKWGVDAAAVYLLNMVTTSYIKICKVSDDPFQTTQDTAQQHVQAILSDLNRRLDDCRLFVSGRVENPSPTGFVNFSVNASSLDGETLGVHHFRTSLLNQVAADANEMISLLPQTSFRQCKRLDSTPAPAAARSLVVGILAQLNAAMENCIFGVSGRIGVVDEHGDFVYVLSAYQDDEERTLEPVRFTGNVYRSAEDQVKVLLQLVPSQEFKSCRQGKA